MKRLLIILKTLLARWFLVIEFCHDCGQRQEIVWWADNPLYHEVTGEPPVDGDNMAGVLCPACFDRRASAKGISLRWTPRVEYRF